MKGAKVITFDPRHAPALAFLSLSIIAEVVKTWKDARVWAVFVFLRYGYCLPSRLHQRLIKRSVDEEDSKKT